MMLRVFRNVLAGLFASLACSALAVAERPATEAGPSRSTAQRPEPPPAIKVQPRDDSASDPSFLAFKQRLLSAAKRGDLAVLRASMPPTLNAGFETATREQVIEAEGLSEGTPWLALVEALELGVAREPEQPDVFIAPYLSASSAQLLPFEDFAVVGRGVRLRTSPSVDAPSLESLSFDVVRLLSYEWGRESREPWSPGNPRHWIHVLTATGTTGYVFGQYLRASTDMRFIFQKVNGRWLLTMLAAGD